MYSVFARNDISDGRPGGLLLRSFRLRLGSRSGRHFDSLTCLLGINKYLLQIKTRATLRILVREDGDSRNPYEGRYSMEF